MLDGADATGQAPDWRRRRDDAVLELLYGSGVRVAELCGLSRGDLDLRGGAVVVWGKGGQASVGCRCQARRWKRCKRGSPSRMRRAATGYSSCS